MKPTLAPGVTHKHSFTVTEEKTVPFLYPESPDFVAMPKVFATGFMVGFIEWACLEALAPHLDDGEGSLGIHIDVDISVRTVSARQIVHRCTSHIRLIMLARCLFCDHHALLS